MNGMTFKGEARRLDAVDIPKIAYQIGCGEDHLRAVLQVETRGGGFDKHGRPKMLFEPHVFYRNLSGAEREAAVSAGLAYRRWGQEPYPSDSYPRLKKAMEIDADAALKSSSWGLGQILGENFRMAGYQAPRDMVEAFLDDEETHLAGMVSFIISAGLDDELRNGDWRGFARGYNGAGYAKHGYHTKLAAAFREWQGKPDVPFSPDRTEQNPNPPQDPVIGTRGRTLKRGMRGQDIRLLQQTLAELGYHSGRADGIFGKRTGASVRAFQGEAGVEADGVVGENTWTALESAQPRPERDVTLDDLRAEGSRTVGSADKAEIAGLGILTLPMVQNGMEIWRESKGFIDWATSMMQDNWPWVLGALALGGLLLWLTGHIKAARVDDARKGRNMGR